MDAEILKDYVPLDKSWMIRMGVLDLIHKRRDIVDFLEDHPNISGDLKSLYWSVKDWQRGSNTIPVGEAGTLYRMLRYVSWDWVDKGILDRPKGFAISGTLRLRAETMWNDPKQIYAGPEELLNHPPKTSQRLSASYLIGKTERVDELLDYIKDAKVFLTYEAKEHYDSQREKGECWQPRYDETIAAQYDFFLRKLKGENPTFIPKHSEDACAAIAFGLMTPEEALVEWPTIAGHESNRPVVMAQALEAYKKGEIIVSDDHRIVTQMSEIYKLDNPEMETEKIKSMFSNPNCVAKATPQHWEFLENALNLVDLL